MTRPRILAFLLFPLIGCAAPSYVRVDRPSLAIQETVLHEEGKFVRDELELFEQSWRPKGEARGAVVLVHGLRDHGSRYNALAHELVGAGLAVYSFDLRGHGSSQGDRVYIDEFEEYLGDLEAFVARVRAREPGKPVYVFGHSMGGAIATMYTLTRKPALGGLVLSGAALKPGADISGFLIGITKFFGAITPSLAVFELDVTKFNRDPEAVKENQTDPLVYQGNGPARTAARLLTALQQIEERMEELTVPLLVLHGGADVITDPEGSKQLHQRAASKDKTLKLYDGLYHDLWHEPERAQVMADLRAWLDARAPKPEAPATASTDNAP